MDCQGRDEGYQPPHIGRPHHVPDYPQYSDDGNDMEDDDENMAADKASTSRTSLDVQAPWSDRSWPEPRGTARDRDTHADPENLRPTRREAASESRSGSATPATSRRSLPEPRGQGRARESTEGKDEDEQPRWRAFDRGDGEPGDPDLLYEPFSDWVRQEADEFHFFNDLLARKEAPDPEHFVSDFVLSDHFLSSQASGKDRAEFEIEMPKHLALLVDGITSESIDNTVEDMNVVFRVNGKTKKLEPVILKEADELSKEDIIKNQDKVDKAILKELACWVDLGALL